MKRALLVFSLIISLAFSGVSITPTKAVDLSVTEENTSCDNPQNGIVRVLNNYDVFSSNGFVYKSDDKYTYIISSSDIVNKTNNYKIMYKNGNEKKAVIIGSDSYNQVAVLRTEKEMGATAVCFANSKYVYKGQQNYVYGYYDISNEFYIKTNLSQIGEEIYQTKYISVYKNALQLDGTKTLRGSGVFDELNRLIGMVTNYDEEFIGTSYIVESNKLLKIANSIVETGKYSVNYIKYNLEDYNGLSSLLKKKYGVNKNVEFGVVITTFKPFNYLFGGLNQGFVIVAVNGIEIKNKYEFDGQLARYEKKDNVCLKVIKKDGKTAFYHVKV